MLLIIEYYVGINTLFKLFFGWIILSIQFLLFEWCKERFGNRIIMRPPWIWEWLDYSMFMEQLLKTMIGVLRTAITGKNKSCFAVVRTLVKPISDMRLATNPVLTWCLLWTNMVRIFSAPNTWRNSSKTSRIMTRYSARRFSNYALSRLFRKMWL